MPNIIRDCPLTSFLENTEVEAKVEHFVNRWNCPEETRAEMSTPVCIRDPCFPPPRINFFYVSRIAARTPPLSLSLSVSLSGFRFSRKTRPPPVDWTNFGSERAGTAYVSWQCLLPSSPQPPDENIIIVDKEKDTLFRSEFRGKISLKIGKNRDEENRGISLLYELVLRVLLSDNILHSK